MNEKQILIFELTSLCNSHCEDCLRAGMNKENYVLSYDDIIKSLNEIKLFSKNFNTFEIKLSGGEPTIWRDKEKNINDIINECSKMNFNFALVSNGKIFAKDEKCEKFFERLTNDDINYIKIYITIDSFHMNYEKYNSNKILDNLFKYSGKINLDLYVQSTVTRNKSDNLPIEFIEYYSKKGVKFIMNPLLPWGRGEKLESSVPYLDLNDNNKKSLGDYEKYYYILGLSKKIWNNYNDFSNYNNLDSIKKINCCGKTITFMEGKYYYCMPCSGKKNFEFANLGYLSYKKYTEFISNNKIVSKFKKNNFNNINLPSKCAIGYGVCDICRKVVENDTKYEQIS